MKIIVGFYSKNVDAPIRKTYLHATLDKEDGFFMIIREYSEDDRNSRTLLKTTMIPNGRIAFIEKIHEEGK